MKAQGRSAWLGRCIGFVVRAVEEDQVATTPSLLGPPSLSHSVGVPSEAPACRVALAVSVAPRIVCYPQRSS